MLMKIIREDKIYIEKLKEEIITITAEKNKIIQKTTEIIDELKSDNLILIEKIEKISIEKDKTEKEKAELCRKSEEIGKKFHENRQLKQEIEKVKSNTSKETNRIEVYKDKEINLLKSRLKLQVKLEKDLDDFKKEIYKLQNSNNEMKVELNRQNTVRIIININIIIKEIIKLNCEKSKLESFNHSLKEANLKIEKLYTESRSSLLL